MDKPMQADDADTKAPGTMASMWKVLQTDSALRERTLNILMPTIAIAFALAWNYPLSRKVHADIRSQLATRDSIA